LFEGEFNDGILDSKINGQGTYTSLSESQYVGEWKNGNMNGQGTYTWSDEDKYEGNRKSSFIFYLVHKGNGRSEAARLAGFAY